MKNGFIPRCFILLSRYRDKNAQVATRLSTSISEPSSEMYETRKFAMSFTRAFKVRFTEKFLEKSRQTLNNFCFRLFERYFIICKIFLVLSMREQMISNIFACFKTKDILRTRQVIEKFVLLWSVTEQSKPFAFKANTSRTLKNEIFTFYVFVCQIVSKI